MKRRLMLLGGTLLGLLMAFGGYYFFAGSADYFTPESDVLPPQGEGRYGETEQKAPLAMLRDEDGRLEGMYKAADWEVQEDGSYLLIKPHVTRFMTSGQTLIIQADKGRIYAEEVARGINPRRGSLDGNVLIVFDRSNDPDRAPIEGRPADLVRIYVDYVNFDNDKLEIRTDSYVTVLSNEADILGRGLVIRWNEKPRELRMLKIKRGEYMAIKEVPGGFDTVSASERPGRSGAGETTKPAVALSDDEVVAPLDTARFAETLPTTQPVSRPASQPTRAAAPTLASAPTSRPARRKKPVSPAGAPAATRPAAAPTTGQVILIAPAPTTLPASRPAPAASRPSRRNVYRATFSDSVHVDFGGRHMRGIEQLTLNFEWARSSGGVFGERRRRQPAPSSRPATGPAGPATRPVELATQPSRPIVAPPKAKTRPAAPQPVDEPMIITWSGPLILEPVGHTERPSEERFRIEATGRRLVLSDEGTKVYCGKFLYLHPQQLGQLTGAAGAPVRLERGQDEEVICRELRFDRQRGLAQLDGPGSILARGQPTTRPAASRPTTQPTAVNRITWIDSLLARFGDVAVAGPDGVDRQQSAITEIIFRGDVKLTSADTSDFIHGRRLRVWMTTDQDGRQYPTKAAATGDVSARQGGSDLTAEKISVYFRPRPSTDAEGENQQPFEVASMEAEGEVRINHKGEDGLTKVVADGITADVRGRSAVLKGDPASVFQGTNGILGSEIHLDRGAEKVSVRGPGGVKFMNDRTFSGRKLEKPQPVSIAWSEGMDFDGPGNAAEFTGGVRLVSGLSSIECRRMRVTFNEIEGSPKAAEKPSTKPAGEKGIAAALDLEGVTQRQLATALADGNVVLSGRRQDDKGRLAQRIQLAGEWFRYDALTGQIDSNGYGTLLAEDYRPPAKRRWGRRGADDLASTVRRPWQTFFEWHKHMQFLQKSRAVFLDGEVSMVHRSGSHIPTEGLDVADWGKVKGGRTAVLGCGKLIARFAPPSKPTKPKRGADEAADLQAEAVVGPLELFTATRDVILRDSPWELRGQQLRYNRRDGLATLWGFLEGERPTKAFVFRKGRPTSSESFHCYLKDGHIRKVVARKVTGTGAR